MDLQFVDIRSIVPIEVRARIFKYALTRLDKDQALEEYHAKTCVILSELRSGCADPEHLSLEYEMVLQERVNGYNRLRKTVHKTPVLLIALRCAPDLYSQALEIYYRINRFTLNPGWCDLSTLCVDRHLSQTTLRSIRNLDVVTDSFDWDGLLMTVYREGRQFMPYLSAYGQNFNLSRIIPQLTNLQFLGVKLLVNTWEDCAIFLGMVRKLKKLDRVQFEVSAPASYTFGKHPDYTGMLVDGMNEIWGVHAKLLRVDEVGGVFFWQAPQGHTLNWSWALYRQKLQANMIRARDFGDCHCNPPLRLGGSNPYVWDSDGGKWYLGPQRGVPIPWHFPWDG